jgi:hypothetical protein
VYFYIQSNFFNTSSKIIYSRLTEKSLPVFVEIGVIGLLVGVSVVPVPENAVLLDDGVRFEVSDDDGSEFDELPVLIDSVELVLLSLNKVGVLFGSVEVTDPVLLKVEVSEIPVRNKVVVISEVVTVETELIDVSPWVVVGCVPVCEVLVDGKVVVASEVVVVETELIDVSPWAVGGCVPVCEVLVDGKVVVASEVVVVETELIDVSPWVVGGCVPVCEVLVDGKVVVASEVVVVETELIDVSPWVVGGCVPVCEAAVDGKVVVASEVVPGNNPFVVVCPALNVVDLSFVAVVDASFILRKQ